jgi:hypothetical protein
MRSKSSAPLTGCRKCPVPRRQQPTLGDLKPRPLKTESKSGFVPRTVGWTWLASAATVNESTHILVSRRYCKYLNCLVGRAGELARIAGEGHKPVYSHLKYRFYNDLQL